MTSPFPSLCSENHTERSRWKCCYTCSGGEHGMAQLSHGEDLINAFCI